MNREEILLREYETCQSHNNSLGQQAWVSISIIVTVNILAMVQVVYNLVLTTTPTGGFGRLVLVALISFVMIIILGIFKRWDRRIDFTALLNNKRMRQIETTLSMWKNWRVYGCDLRYRKEKGGKQAEEEWKTLLGTQQKYIEELFKQEKYVLPTTEGSFWKLRWKFDWIFCILIALWSIMIALEALIYCPTVYHWLFN